jgi:hypothetical protein
MFLILDQHLTEFGLRLRGIAERKGLVTLPLTSAEIARDSTLAFLLSEEDLSLRLHCQGITISIRDIDGVYCGINAFEPKLWEWFSPEDADYAARETQALWLAILASLPCRVVNPPALDSLAGTLLSTPEILYVALQIGFRIPTVISLESGKVAAELFKTGIPGRYADLGEVWLNEIGLSQDDLSSLEQNEDHFRVMEEVPGRPVHVTLLGADQFFACQMDTGGSVVPVAARQIPRPIRTRLRTFHKRLNLNLAEYSFRVMADDTWVFIGCGRPPTFGVAAHGDTLLEQIVDYATGKER